MKIKDNENGDKYEIIIKKFGRNELVETDIMGERETQEVLYLIGKLNLRSAYAG